MAKENHIKRILLNVNRNKKPKIAEWADNQDNVTQSILWLIENWTANTGTNEDLFAYLAKNYNSLPSSSRSNTQEKKKVNNQTSDENDKDLSNDSEEKQKEKKEESSTTETPKIAIPSNMNYLHKSND